MVQRRARVIDGLGRGQGPDQFVQIAALELVGVAGQGGHVGDAVIVGAGLEHRGLRQGAQHRIAAGAAAADGSLVRVDLARAAEIFRHRGHVLDVDHAPFAVQALAIGPPVAGAAAIIDVGDSETPRGPELDGRAEGRRGLAGRAAVDQHQQGRPGAIGRAIAEVSRCVIVGVGGAASRGREGDLFGVRDHVRRQAGLPGAAHHPVLPGPHIDHDDRGQGVGRQGDHRRVVGVDPLDRAQAGEGQGQVLGRPPGRVNQQQMIAAALAVARQYPAVVQHRVIGLAKLPEWARELGFAGRDRPRRGAVEGVEVPEVGPVGDEIERPARRPARLHHRFCIAAGDHPQVRQPAAGQVANVKAGGVPRHVGMVPGHEGQPPSVRADTRVGHEIAGLEHHPTGVALCAGHQDQRVSHVSRIGMVLAHADQTRITGQRGEVGIAVAGRRQRARLRADLLHIEALVDEIAEKDPGADHRIGRAAVLMDPRADVQGLRRQGADAAVAVFGHQGQAPALAGVAFGPEQPSIDRAQLRKVGLVGGQALGGDRRGPGAVGRDDGAGGGFSQGGRRYHP